LREHGAGIWNDEGQGKARFRLGVLRPGGCNNIDLGLGANVPELSLRRRHPLHRRLLSLW